ncbi:MAG TPA: SagB/ThcOx family dehydrogenase [Herpetosiphonaceae bacterium]
MFRDKYPLAWTFHRNTSRWPFNMQPPREQTEPEAQFKEYLSAPLFPLPEPQPPMISLGEAITRRCSCRRFSAAPMSLPALSTLLKLAYGVQDQVLLGEQEFMERPVASGGGLYPLELYLFVQRVDQIAPGVYHYAPQPHALEQLSATPVPSPLLGDLFMGQPYVGDAAVVLVLTTIVERSLWKYTDRGYRYILFEAGHVAQTVNLVAGGLGLGALNLGGFFDANMAALLGLDLEDEVPLYGLAVGVPTTGDRNELRQPAG